MRFSRTWRRFLACAAMLLGLLQISLLASASPQSREQVGPGYDIEMSRMIPMRDGVELEAWIFKPSHLTTKAPAVLELTQYDIDGGRHRDFEEFVRRGYVFVQVYVRGRGRSGGSRATILASRWGATVMTQSSGSQNSRGVTVASSPTADPFSV